MGFDKYLMMVRKLNNIERWATEYMHKHTTVSQHTFMVEQIGQMLGIIEEERGNTVDWKRLFFKMHNHDVIETVTGDILSTIKHKDPQMRQMVERIEIELAEERLIGPLSKEFQERYRSLLFDGKDDSLEGKILTAADDIDALLECINEIRLHNTIVFEQKFKDIFKKLRTNNITSVDYFITKILPGLIKGCKEIEDYMLEIYPPLTQW